MAERERSLLPSGKRTRLRVLGGMLLAFAALSFVIFISFQSLSNLVTALHDEALPNKKMLLVKDLLFDLSDAESSVEARSLGRDSIYFQPLEIYAMDVEKKLFQLDSLTQGSSDKQQLLDTIADLIDQKFVLLDSLSRVRNDDRVLSALEKVSRDIDKVIRIEEQINLQNQPKEEEDQPILDSSSEAEEEDKSTGASGAEGDPDEKQPEEEVKKEKKGFLKRIFRKKNKENKETEATPKDTIVPEAVPEVETVEEGNPDDSEKKKPGLIKTLEKKVERAKKKEERELEALAITRLTLMLQKADLTAKIRDHTNRFETIENEDSLVKAEEASFQSLRTRIVIALLSVFAFLFLVVSAYFGLRYLRRTTRYNLLLKREKQRAEELARAKEEFLSFMSHEIRTPMNSVIGFAEQLSETELESQQSRYLHTIRSSADHLLGIINEVLDNARLESGKVNLEQIPFEVQKELETAIATLRPQADKKQLEVTAKTDAQIPPVLIGDPLRLRQIIINLAGNALKFTDKGGVYVRAWLVSNKVGEIKMGIEVRDTGIGIPKEKLENLFEAFSQVEDSTYREYGGTGLGLSITKQLTEAQGGKISVESTEGKGTAFKVLLPYKVGESMPPPAHAGITPDKASALKGLKMLVVDDEPYNRELIKAMISNWEVQWVEAGSGEEALEILEQVDPDIALLDLRMPGIDGLETARRIRKLGGKRADMPLIALTAGASQEAKETWRESGLDLLLNKPFRKKQLLAALLHVLGEEISEELQDQHFEEMENNQELPDLSELRKIAKGNEGFVRHMLGVFEKSSQDSLAEIENGFEEKDKKRIAINSHRMASSARHLGLLTLRNDLKELERQADANATFPVLDQLYQDVKTKALTAIEAVKAELEG